MMQPQPMIVVRDIQACSQWFQGVLGLSSGHGTDEYEMLITFWDGYILSTEDTAAVARNLGAKIGHPTHCKSEDAVKLREMLEPAVKVDIGAHPTT